MKSADNAAMASGTNRPNLLIILADDLGFADIGCYGGQIPTPALDRLAAHGLRFSQFYNTARCCPSRASLLTGLHPHQAGIGLMSEDPRWKLAPDSPPGYRRRLNRNCVTLAEVLGASGYHTYMAGKWHVGMHGRETWPLQRGFERFYGIVAGACSYLRPHGDRYLVLDNAALPPPEGDYYTTDAFTDFGIRCLKEQKDDAPFFLYMAYNAPHWPLHARQEDIDRFVGAYRKGWDALREELHRRQLTMGLVKEEWGLSARDEGARPWRDLSEEQQRQLDYRMAVYAAQVHRMDANIGRLVKTLEDLGCLDNTLILFLSDNGGCAEPYTDLGGGAFEDINNPERSGAISYGQGWANASNTPFRKFKVFVHEGGISTPLIAHWPAGIQTPQGAITDTPAYLIDIMPTMVELSGAAYPTYF
ncbi:MAG: arylsulfatase, partial [Candidatus Sumerlaeota bacterium]|nr:arylsulfatase [Candidatus Sumerlaeota bacterium]